MKRKFLICFFTVPIIILLSGYLRAQSFSINGGADLVSRYVWRGLNINDQPSIQPYITSKYSGFQLGFWGSYGLSHMNSSDDNYSLNHEIDTWLSYTYSIEELLNFTVIATDYYFPNAGIKLGNFNNYNHVHGPGAHTIEAGFIVSGKENFPLSLSGYMNIYNDKGNNIFVQADYSTTVSDVVLGVFIGAAAGSKDTPNYYGTEKFNVINTGIKLSKAIKITTEYSLPVNISYVMNPSVEISYLIFGISF